MLAGKCVTPAEVGADWHNRSASILLLRFFFFAFPSLSLTHTTLVHMKPGHAPSEQQNTQLPPVGLKGPDLKNTFREIAVTQKPIFLFEMQQ